MWGIEIVVMAAMIGINSILAAYEIALASVTLARLDALAKLQQAGAVAAVYMKRNLEGSLAGIQLGITLVGAVAAATGGAGAEEGLAPVFQEHLHVSAGVAEFLAIATVVAPLTLMTIIFGELIPKVFALRNKEWVCLKLSPLIRLFVLIVWPIVWFLETIVNRLVSWGERLWGKVGKGIEQAEATELQELRASVTLARTSRLIGPQEEKIMIGAASLTSLPVSKIMLPADAISMLDADGLIADALIAAHLDMHTRFPVTEVKNDPQTIIGYVNFKDIVSHLRISPHGGDSVRKIIRPIPRFDLSIPVSACLERLIRDHVHIALICDAEQRIQGMVTMEDIVEELVGDIEDEFDHLPTHIVSSGNGWVVGGGVLLDKLREQTTIDFTAPPAEPTWRLSDWVQQKTGQPTIRGLVLQESGHRIVVRKVRRQKVLEAQIERQPQNR